MNCGDFWNKMFREFNETESGRDWSRQVKWSLKIEVEVVGCRWMISFQPILLVYSRYLMKTLKIVG